MMQEDMNTETAESLVGGIEDMHDLEDARNATYATTSERTAASLSASGVSAREIAVEAAHACSDKKADDVVVLDLTELSDVCDYFVIATGSNGRLADAMVDEVEEKVAKAYGEHPFSIEGRDERSWILMDYGSVIVHIFAPEAREYYRIEKLWGDAPVLDCGLE